MKKADSIRMSNYGLVSTKRVLWIFLVMISTMLFSCVNSGMYHTSLGKKPVDKYDKDDADYRVKDTVDADGYRYISMENPSENSKKNSSSSEEKSMKQTYTLSNKRVIMDTVISKKYKTVTVPIDEAKKDSLIVALATNSKMSQAEKDRRLTAFFDNNTKKVEYLDTSIVQREIQDTIWHSTDEQKVVSYSLGEHRFVKDTVITTKYKTIKLPIDEEKKDSLFFALAKDETLSEAQKEKKLEAFFASHKKKVPYVDTTVVTKEVQDTIWNVSYVSAGDSALDNKSREELMVMVAELQRQVNELQNADTRKEKREIKKKINLTAKQLYTIGRREGKLYHDASRAFWIPFLGSLVSLIMLFIPFISPWGVYGLLGSLSAGIFYLFYKPDIPWHEVPSKYNMDENYRKGYEEEARKKNQLNALLGLGLFGVSFVLVLILIFSLLLFL